MTREDKIKMFEMRMDGYTYAEIGKKWGISKQRVEQILNPRKKDKFFKNVKFIGLADWMQKNNRNLKSMTSVIGASSLSTFSTKAKGIKNFTLPEIKSILNETGMTFEECFKVKDIETDE